METNPVEIERQRKNNAEKNIGEVNSIPLMLKD